MSRLPFAPLLLAGTALVGGCFDLSSPNTGSLRLSPILDSMFVGDTLSPRTVTFYDANGTPQSPGVVKWHITLDSVGGVPNPVATIDSVTGKIVGRRRGATVVMTLSSTSAGGRFFASVLGISIRHTGGSASAVNFRRTTTPGRLAFRLVDSIGSSTGPLFERLMITLADSVVGVGRFDIDTLSPDEATPGAGALGAVCNPPRSWGLWSSSAGSGIVAFSHSLSSVPSSGEISVTQYHLIPGGYVISGRYTFTAQRRDLYTDDLGLLTIHGSFVTPLVTYSTSCEP